MQRANSTGTLKLGGMALLLASATMACTGCQVDVGGQTLPSAYYINDDVQYFPAGPEFKLSNEAEAMRSYSEDENATEK
jgi:hypothetical protein